MSERSLRVAVLGSGPAGFYAAQALLSVKQIVRAPGGPESGHREALSPIGSPNVRLSDNSQPYR